MADNAYTEACKNGNLELVRRYIQEEGCSPDDCDSKYWTPLVAAAYHGHDDLVVFLIQQGADLNTRDENDGWTPLISAAYKGHSKIVETLLEQGADQYLRDKKGRNAADLAEKEGHSRIGLLLKAARKWRVLSDEKIQHFSLDGDLSVTRTFNFRAMNVMTVVSNTADKLQSHQENAFCDPSVDYGLLLEAKEEFLKTGKKIDESTFSTALKYPLKTRPSRTISRRKN